MSIPESIRSGTNPTYLPARYEIRQLTSAHIPWASAIILHSNVFYSPIWPLIYPENKTRRLLQGMAPFDYLVRHQIDSGMSFGVFDTQYEYKRPESASSEGKLYWDEEDLEADSATLLEQMDFPLVSIALAYDGFHAMDMQRLTPLMEVLPLFGTLYGILQALDKRDEASWKAQAPQQVLMRNATSTRADYEGQGLMKKLAQWLMREAAGKGFRGIQIECAHDAVTHTWLHPPRPFSADLIAKLDTATFEQEGADGKPFRPFEPSKQVCTKIYVTLKQNQPAGSLMRGDFKLVAASTGALA